MKGFRELMEIREENNIGLYHFRLFKAIKIGKFDISVQASQGHYCSPRETLPIEDYTSMEIAIFEGEKWINPTSDDRFKKFSRYDELNFEDGGYPVSGWVDIDLIQDLCNYIETIE